MKTTYLFPHRFKMPGLYLLVPSIILGFIAMYSNWEPAIFDVTLPSLFKDPVIADKQLFTTLDNNLFNELIGVLIIIGGILVAFSREKEEDEYISRIRLESLVWATYVNFAVLTLAIIFIYDMLFFWVLVFNMFTILIFFIIRFNWQLSKISKTVSYE